MNRCAYLMAMLICVLLASAALCQDPPPSTAGQQPGGPPGVAGPGGPGFGFRMPVFPLLETLDADQDGKLSKQEIDDAVAALKKLDKDADGKLSKEEIGWPPAGMGRRGRRGPGMGPGGGPGGAAEAPSSGPTLSFVERIMTNDKDGDGKVTKEELPDRMKWMTRRLDTNQDGAIDKSEAEAASTPPGQKK